MRKVIYAMTVSLDGFVETADRSIDWTAPDEELHTHFNEREADIDVHLYGRRLYELMAASWPGVYQDRQAPPHMAEYARIWMSKPKVVFSTTLQRVDWNARLAGEDVAREVQTLKAQPGTYISVGGPTLASSLMRLGLIDEYWLYLSPLILGGGNPLFRPLENRIPVTLVETRTFGSGVTLLRYRAASSGG